MTFEPDKVQEFLAIFNESKLKIRLFPGCSHLELHRDFNDENIYTTFSMWDSQEAINAYRNSELFQSVWPRTKALFSKSPIAFSNIRVEGPILLE